MNRKPEFRQQMVIIYCVQSDTNLLHGGIAQRYSFHKFPICYYFHIIIPPGIGKLPTTFYFIHISFLYMSGYFFSHIL